MRIGMMMAVEAFILPRRYKMKVTIPAIVARSIQSATACPVTFSIAESK